MRRLFVIHRKTFSLSLVVWRKEEREREIYHIARSRERRSSISTDDVAKKRKKRGRKKEEKGAREKEGQREEERAFFFLASWQLQCIYTSTYTYISKHLHPSRVHVTWTRARENCFLSFFISYFFFTRMSHQSLKSLRHRIPKSPLDGDTER